MHALSGAGALPATLLALPFTLIWASAFPVAKFVFADSPPLLFLAARFLLAGALLIGWAVWHGELWGMARRLGGRDWAALLLFAALGRRALGWRPARACNCCWLAGCWRRWPC